MGKALLLEELVNETDEDSFVVYSGILIALSAMR